MMDFPTILPKAALPNRTCVEQSPGLPSGCILRQLQASELFTVTDRILWIYSSHIAEANKAFAFAGGVCAGIVWSSCVAVGIIYADDLDSCGISTLLAVGLVAGFEDPAFCLWICCLTHNSILS